MPADADRSPATAGDRQRLAKYAIRCFTPEVETVLKTMGAVSLRIPLTSPAVKRRAFEEDALAHLDALYRTALRLTRNRARAEDLVQDAYLRAFRKLHQFELGTNCRAWLFTIMRRLFLNSLRGRDREQLADDPDSCSSAEASATAPAIGNPEREFIRTVLSRDVDRALKSLPLVFREAVILVYLEGFSYREAAEVLACPVGTVMSRLSRGRHLLRQALSRGDAPASHPGPASATDRRILRACVASEQMKTETQITERGRRPMNTRLLPMTTLAVLLLAGPAFATPKPAEIQAPRDQEIQAPRGQDTQAPRSQDVQAPRGQDVQAPRGQDIQAP